MNIIDETPYRHGAVNQHHDSPDTLQAPHYKGDFMGHSPQKPTHFRLLGHVRQQGPHRAKLISRRPHRRHYRSEHVRTGWFSDSWPSAWFSASRVPSRTCRILSQTLNPPVAAQVHPLATTDRTRFLKQRCRMVAAADPDPPVCSRKVLLPGGGAPHARCVDDVGGADDRAGPMLCRSKSHRC